MLSPSPHERSVLLQEMVLSTETLDWPMCREQNVNLKNTKHH